jgi:hypothetical protein
MSEGMPAAVCVRAAAGVSVCLYRGAVFFIWLEKGTKKSKVSCVVWLMSRDYKRTI